MGSIASSSGSARRSPARAWAAAGAALLVLSASAPGSARADEIGALASDAGWGAASAFSTLLYAPAKVAFAIGGGLVGGLTWAFSGGDGAAAKAVLVPSATGDYLVTREHLDGRRALRFFGAGPTATPGVAAGR